MRTHVLGPVLLMTFSLVGFAQEPVRTWTDSTGAILLSAELVSVEKDVVTLKDRVGFIVTMPIARLSAADQEFLRSVNKPADNDASPRDRKVAQQDCGGIEHNVREPLRGRGARKATAEKRGGTTQSERAVAGALNWLARHQLPEGNWSIVDFSKRCAAVSPCSGVGSEKQDTGATAMALLPFLAGGQTHLVRGPYQKSINAGIYWLLRQQKSDGDLRGGGSMYSHGLAAIALCEAYGLSGDKNVGAAAQKAINFIQAAQNKTTGGWRYSPGDQGDTSVVGWQLMAIKTGEMADLVVNPVALEKTKGWLKSCSRGNNGEQFAYEPNGFGTPPMTAVGLLCHQYLGTQRDDPRMVAGAKYLSTNMPEMNARNAYYWYHATQVMYNVSGPQWDDWNLAMQKTLIDSQDTEGCAAGSWDPAKPRPDPWGRIGGRIMMTALSALMLEVYYRYPGVYEAEKGRD